MRSAALITLLWLAAPKWPAISRQDIGVNLRARYMQSWRGSRTARVRLEEAGASFIVTGEVLGERPMSQRREAMALIEKEAVPASMMRLVRIDVRFEKRPPLKEVDRRLAVLEQRFMRVKDDWGLDSVAVIISPVFSRLMLVLPDDRPENKYTAKQLQDMAMNVLDTEFKWPGVTFDSSGGEMGGPPGQENATSIKVRGPDPAQVYQFAETIRKMLAGTPDLKEIKPLDRSNDEELHVQVDRELARVYGFDVGQVAMAVSYSIRGVPVGQLHAGDSPLDIYIQLSQADRQTVATLRKAILFLADPARRQLLTTRILRLLPEYVSAGRHLDA